MKVQAGVVIKQVLMSLTPVENFWRRAKFFGLRVWTRLLWLRT